MNVKKFDFNEEFNHLKGKKLLIIGAVKHESEIVIRAKKMGIYVVVADYKHNSPAKKVADEGILIDALDVEGLCDFCIKENVDGVITGFVDILMPICYEVCKRLDLPCYFTEKMIEVSTNKNEFKKICNDFDIPITRNYDVDINDLNKLNSLSFPVFVKPLDSSGSRGANVSKSINDLLKHYKIAEEFSSTQNVVIEEFLTGKEVLLDYLIFDGEPRLLSINDRLITDDRNLAINYANANISPSCDYENFMSSINPKIVNMCKSLNFKNGILFFQGFVSKGEFKFYEMGCRLGGTFPAIDEYFLKINPIDLLIHFSLTGKMADLDVKSLINAKFKGFAGWVNFLLKNEDNEICDIVGLSKLEDIIEIIYRFQFLNIGDKIIKSNRMVDKPILSVFCASDNYNKLISTMDKVSNSIDIIGKNGKSLLLPRFDLINFDAIKYKGGFR